MSKREKLCNLNHSDYLMYLFEYRKHTQNSLDKRPRVIAPFYMCFAPLKCKVLLQTWALVASSSVLDEEELTGVDIFSFIGSCLTKDGSRLLRMGTRTSWAQAAYLWHRPGISLKLKGRVYCCNAFSSVL